MRGDRLSDELGFRRRLSLAAAAAAAPELDRSEVFIVDVFGEVLATADEGDGHDPLAFTVFSEDGNGGASGIVAMADGLGAPVATLAVRCRMLATLL